MFLSSPVLLFFTVTTKSELLIKRIAHTGETVIEWVVSIEDIKNIYTKIGT